MACHDSEMTCGDNDTMVVMAWVGGVVEQVTMSKAKMSGTAPRASNGRRSSRSVSLAPSPGDDDIIASAKLIASQVMDHVWANMTSIWPHLLSFKHICNEVYTLRSRNTSRLL